MTDMSLECPSVDVFKGWLCQITKTEVLVSVSMFLKLREKGGIRSRLDSVRKSVYFSTELVGFFFHWCKANKWNRGSVKQLIKFDSEEKMFYEVTEDKH